MSPWWLNPSVYREGSVACNSVTSKCSCRDFVKFVMNAAVVWLLTVHVTVFTLSFDGRCLSGVLRHTSSNGVRLRAMFISLVLIRNCYNAITNKVICTLETVSEH